MRKGIKENYFMIIALKLFIARHWKKIIINFIDVWVVFVEKKSEKFIWKFLGLKLILIQNLNKNKFLTRFYDLKLKITLKNNCFKIINLKLNSLN